MYHTGLKIGNEWSKSRTLEFQHKKIGFIRRILCISAMFKEQYKNLCVFLEKKTLMKKSRCYGLISSSLIFPDHLT